MPRTITVSLPVADLKASVAFYTALGFVINPQCSGETGAFMASTSSRVSQEMLSATSLVVAGAIGRVVSKRHCSCVNSITLIVSLSTMSAPVSPEHCGLMTKPSAV